MKKGHVLVILGVIFVVGILFGFMAFSLFSNDEPSYPTVELEKEFDQTLLDEPNFKYSELIPKPELYFGHDKEIDVWANEDIVDVHSIKLYNITFEQVDAYIEECISMGFTDLVVDDRAQDHTKFIATSPGGSYIVKVYGNSFQDPELNHVSIICGPVEEE